VFCHADQTNECNLAGSLGLFPLASSERSNFYGKRRCLTGRATPEDPMWGEPDVMSAMLNIKPRSPENIILKKEMVVLVDDVRSRFPRHQSVTAQMLLDAVKLAWWRHLCSFYRDDWK
jgi:hypothetical protein